MKPLLVTTILPHCWVCGQKFGPSVKQEDHHIIPRAYGGVDGPVVSLCDSHHTALHEIALKLYTKKSYFNLLTKDKEVNAKLLWLATVAYNARLATENDPNKKPILMEPISRETFNKLLRLKQVFPKASRKQIVESAINNLYAKHFTN